MGAVRVHMCPLTQWKAPIAPGAKGKTHLKPVWISFGCISILHFTDFSVFSSFGYKFRKNPNFYYS